VTTKQLAKCRQRLQAFTEEMLAPLGRSERRHWGSVYVRGLVLDGERKSVGAMAERLPEGNEQSLQPFVSQSPWPWEPVWQRWAQKLAQTFAPLAWIVDDTGFPKKGEHSVGVARQSLGHARHDGELPSGGESACHQRYRQFAAGLPLVLAERMDGRPGATPPSGRAG
jgi:SRSO17 transposase